MVDRVFPRKASKHSQGATIIRLRILQAHLYTPWETRLNNAELSQSRYALRRGGVEASFTP